jgi:hypothetical protein
LVLVHPKRTMDDPGATNVLAQFLGEKKRAREIASEVSGVVLSPATMNNIRLTARALHETDYASRGATRPTGTPHRTEPGPSTPLPQAETDIIAVLEGQMKRVMQWAPARFASIPEAQPLLTERLPCQVVCVGAAARGTAAIDSLDPDAVLLMPWVIEMLAFVKKVMPEAEAALSPERLTELLEVARGRMDTQPPAPGHSSVVSQAATDSRRVSHGPINAPATTANAPVATLRDRAKDALVLAIAQWENGTRSYKLLTRDSVGADWSSDDGIEDAFEFHRHLVVDTPPFVAVKDYRIYRVVPPQTPFGAVVACSEEDAKQQVLKSMSWPDPEEHPSGVALPSPYLVVTEAANPAEATTASPSTATTAATSDANAAPPSTAAGPSLTVFVLDAESHAKSTDMGKATKDAMLAFVAAAAKAETKQVVLLADLDPFLPPVAVQVEVDARASLDAVRRARDLMWPHLKTVGIETRTKGSPTWKPSGGRRVASLFNGDVQEADVRLLVAHVWPPHMGWNDPSGNENVTSDGTDESHADNPTSTVYFDGTAHAILTSAARSQAACLDTSKDAGAAQGTTLPNVALLPFPAFAKTLITPDMSCVMRKVDNMMAKVGVSIEENALLVSGNPGIGKSTILSVILERLVHRDVKGWIIVAYFSRFVRVVTRERGSGRFTYESFNSATDAFAHARTLHGRTRERVLVLHDSTTHVRFSCFQIGRLSSTTQGAIVLAASPAEINSKEFLKEVPADVYYMPPLTEAEAVLYGVHFARHRAKDANHAAKRFFYVGGICRHLASDAAVKAVCDSLEREAPRFRGLNSEADFMQGTPSVMACMYPTPGRESYTWGFVSEEAQRWRLDQVTVESAEQTLQRYVNARALNQTGDVKGRLFESFSLSHLQFGKQPMCLSRARCKGERGEDCVPFTVPSLFVETFTGMKLPFLGAQALQEPKLWIPTVSNFPVVDAVMWQPKNSKWAVAALAHETQTVNTTETHGRLWLLQCTVGHKHPPNVERVADLKKQLDHALSDVLAASNKPIEQLVCMVWCVPMRDVSTDVMRAQDVEGAANNPAGAFWSSIPQFICEFPTGPVNWAQWVARTPDSNIDETRAIAMRHRSEDPHQVMESRFGREFERISRGPVKGKEVTSAIKFAEPKKQK